MYFYWKRASDLTFFSISAFKGNFLWKDHLRRSQGIILKAKTRTQIQYIYNFQVWPLQVKQSMVDFNGAGDQPLSCQDYSTQEWNSTSDIVTNIIYFDSFWHYDIVTNILYCDIVTNITYCDIVTNIIYCDIVTMWHMGSLRPIIRVVVGRSRSNN